MDLATAINTWQTYKKQAKDYAELELAWRNYVFGVAFTKPELGTNRVPLGNSADLKAVVRNNYKLEKGNALEAALMKLPPALRGVVKWEPKLSQSAYDALEPAHRAIINEVLTITPGVPGLEIEDKAK